MSRYRILAFLLFLAIPLAYAQTPTAIPKLEVYVTAPQVIALLSTLEGCENAFRVFQEIGIGKIYLETLHGGIKPNPDTLKQARDFFRERGLEVAGGAVTTPGPQFGVPTDQGGMWLNYQNEKTRRDMAEHFRNVAGLFDEFLIDDFLATDDQSEESRKAKGESSWSQYRLNLMTDFAERCMIAPAKQANPAVRLIIKYPQWYDRFHLFGYDVVRGPRIFDRIWVGTETRNPDTVRFGYVMPTQGYINYSWLRSLAGEKTGGAWYDFGDCTQNVFLMQAYQSVLAGARELIFFEADSIVNKNDCLNLFLQRRKAVWGLGELLQGHKPLGPAAYKPPHSDGSDPSGSANLYIYDYLATLGLSPVPVAEAPRQAECIFLARQAADDPNLRAEIRKWLSESRTLVVTPDLLWTLRDEEIMRAAGYSQPLTPSREYMPVIGFSVEGKRISTPLPTGSAGTASPTASQVLRSIPLPDQAKVQCAGITTTGEIPLLSSHPTASGGKMIVLNLSTFAHEEFTPGKEQFLPPRPLPVRNWPEAVVNRIRREIPYPYGFQIEAPNNLGVYFYEGRLLVLANFSSEPAVCSIIPPKNESIRMALHESFPHVPAVTCRQQAGAWQTTVPPWELVVAHW